MNTNPTHGAGDKPTLKTDGQKEPRATDPEVMFGAATLGTGILDGEFRRTRYGEVIVEPGTSPELAKYMAQRGKAHMDAVRAVGINLLDRNP